MWVVLSQVAVTLPNKETFFGAHGLGLYQSHVDKHLDTLLDHVLLDHFSFAVIRNLLQDCSCEVCLAFRKYCVIKERHAFLTNKLQLVIPEVVPIEILKGSVHHLGINAVILPHFDQVHKQLLALSSSNEGLHFSGEVLAHEVLKDRVDLLVVVVRVTLVNDELVDLHIFCVGCNTHGSTTQIIEQLADKVSVDELLAVRELYFFCHTSCLFYSLSLKIIFG